MFLGAGVDPDNGTLQNTAATADDLSNTGSADDEDGVVFQTPLMPGTVAKLQVTASVAGCLNAWLDWNGNGVLTDAGEQIAANLAVVAGANLITINPVPATSGVVYSRFRFTARAARAARVRPGWRRAARWRTMRWRAWATWCGMTRTATACRTAASRDITG